MFRTLSAVLICFLASGVSLAEGKAQKRAKHLGIGMNLTYLDHHWKGTKEKHFADFLEGGDLAAREEMIAEIAAYGYRTVRIPVCFSAWTSLKVPYKWETEEGLAALDILVKKAREHDLNVIIDQHHPELDGSFPESTNIERIVWIWREIAERYKKTDPEHVYFELWNEPHDIDAAFWRKNAETLIRTVREIAPDHTLIVGFHDWNNLRAMIDSKPFGDGNIIYTFHFYDPFLFTHQGAEWSAEGLPDIKHIPFPFEESRMTKVPASAKGKWSGGLFETYRRDSSEEKILADLKAAKEWSAENEVPIFAGEFGSYGKYAAEKDRCRHFKVVYSAFRELEIPNAAWEWDGGFNMFEKDTNRLLPCVLEAAGLERAEDWKLTWSDEFEGKAGTAADKTKWNRATGGEGWGNKEFQYYTDSAKNAFLDGNGSLVIKAIQGDAPKEARCWYGECRFTSARLNTKDKFAQKYGRFEARIKIPYGQGIWPAFWLLGENIDEVGWPKCGEIDVMENIGREPGKVHGTIHGPGYSGAGGIGASFELSTGRFADEFHIFAVEWEPNAIRWYVDGNLYKTIRAKDLPNRAEWVFDHPHYILLNVAVGGNWPGDPDETTVFPQFMKIDYVRVYEWVGGEKIYGN